MRRNSLAEEVFPLEKEALEEAGHQVRGGRVREAVLGIQDGIISNLGVVLGVSGAVTDSHIVLIAGLATVMAEAVAMFFSQYAASKSAREFRRRELELERLHLRQRPREEAEEVRDIYAAKGFKGKLLDQIVRHITSHPDVWLATMEREEMTWIPSAEPSPWGDALLVGGAAFLAGLLPVFPFFFLPIPLAIPLAILAAVLTLFGAGAVMTRVTGGSKLRSGAEMLAIGLVAAAIGYGVGLALKVLP